MNILVTAGNTLVPIDRVRCLTNVFTGRTGGTIALHAWERGHTVTLFTSHPEVLDGLRSPVPTERWALRPYRTFQDLQNALAESVTGGGDVVIHSAAVSDYRAAGIYAPSASTRFRPDGHWESLVPELPALIDRSAGKVKSDEPELWLRLVRTPKLVDMMRSEWGFRGVLVKFKLEVGIDEPHLLDIAERSRQQSQADLMVANTLEGAADWAYLGPIGSTADYRRITRDDLPRQLLDAVEHLHRERTHG